MTNSSPTPGCCSEYAGLARRTLLRASLIGAATTAFGSAVVRSAPAFAARTAVNTSGNILVVLSLRGACDGLSMVVPHADPAYYSARPRIAIAADQLLVKDQMFGLHPRFAPILPLWNAGSLAFVHATGLPAPNRSHFSAMEELEDASPGSRERDGWLNRLIGLDASDDPLRGLAIGNGQIPTSLHGDHPVSSMREPADVQLAGADQWDTHRGRPVSIRTLWQNSAAPLSAAVRTALAVIDDFTPVRSAPSTPSNGAVYPATDLGKALGHVARVIRSGIGTSGLTIDQGEWDMHTDLGTLTWGAMQRNIDELARGIAAFFADLGPLAQNVTLVGLSEFGRRVRENANYGTDHGYGNVMLLAGAGVRGGRYYGTWTRLADTLDADVPVTTDYRSVLAEVVTKRFGASSATVFPGFSPSTVGALTA